ncbi:MAG: cation transporter [Acidimicrobiia bacterium]|nr:cation transporter [Acidimicrobiia bacterium]
MTATIDRGAAVRRARLLNWFTIGWNGVEGFVAVGAGIVAGSIGLVGFGIDSGIEVSAALILMWRLRRERLDGCRQDDDAFAQRLIAVSFGLLAIYVGVEAMRDLVAGHRPDPSMVGLVMATASLLVMPFVARAKRRLAPVLGSRAVAAEATQTDVCTALSAALVVGLGANIAFGWWWADPLAAIVIAGISGYVAYLTWTADSLDDTCCA